ncbi:P63C domain-containing protein [Limnobacter sp.]|uniref:P63C domain-containing protein n=1 Tax=Limnobacter sp. TaxID=2003368 RepID=UPI002FE25DA9
MENNGKAKGGKVKNAKMTADERKQLSEKMIAARKENASLPTATHFGELKIGELVLPCAVLPDGSRVIAQGGITTAFGPVTGGYQLRKKTDIDHDGVLPPFLVASSLRPFIDNDLRTLVSKPKKYKDPRGGPLRLGVDASLLPKICEVWLKAHDAKALTKNQIAVAERANLLMRGLAHVGIISLVDEATGYQRDRAKDALAKILEAFVAKELQPYLKTFPADYYEHLFRLYGYEFPPKDKRPQWRPIFFGKITNEVVYNRLAPELLTELKKAANKAEKKAKLYQWLSSDFGHPKLKDHLISIVALLKISRTPQQFRDFVNTVHPRFGDTLPLDFGPES